MLVNLVPEFLATLAAPDPSAAYHEYLDRHRPVLSAYWQNYVLDPESPHVESIIDAEAVSRERVKNLRHQGGLLIERLEQEIENSTP